MGMMDRFRTSKRMNEASPRSYAEAFVGDGKPATYFGMDDGTKASPAGCRKILDTGGLVSEAVLCYPLYACTNGYRIEGEDAVLVKKVQDFDDKNDLTTLMFQGILDAIAVSRGVQEKVFTAGGDLVGLVHRQGESFEKVKDKTGKVLAYEQHIIENGMPKVIPLPMVSVKGAEVDPVLWLDLGMPILMRAFDDIWRDCRVVSGIAKSIERHGFPRYHVKVGKEGERVSPTIMRSIGRMFKALKPENEMVTHREIEIINIDASGVPQAKEYSEQSIQRLTAALGVPEEMLGLGRGSTEATANVRLQGFYDKIGMVQRLTARAYNTQVIDLITGAPGAVKIIFNDVSPVDESMRADYIVKLLGAVPADPYAIVSAQYCHDYLDIQDSDWQKPDETPIPPAPNPFFQQGVNPNEAQPKEPVKGN